MLTRPAAKLDRKPTITAFGANGKTVGQSSAGLASFTNLSAIPLKAGTISAIIMRTPGKDDPHACRKGQRLDNGEDDKVPDHPLTLLSTNSLPATSTRITNRIIIVREIATEESRRKFSDFWHLHFFQLTGYLYRPLFPPAPTADKPVEPK